MDYRLSTNLTIILIGTLLLMDESSHRVLQLVTEALDGFDANPLPVTFRRALRIAQLRGDQRAAIRCAVELSGTPQPGDSLGFDAPADLIDDVNREAIEMRARYSDSLPESQDSVAGLITLTLDPLLDVTVVNPIEAELSLHSRLIRNNERVVAKQILYRLMGWVHQYLTLCEVLTTLSITGETIFQRQSARVDELLSSIAPGVLEKLNSAIKRAMETGDVESRSQALLSCRRVLVTVADLVFPARSEQYLDASGKLRNVGALQYRNRIVAFVESADENTRSVALKVAIEFFALSLDRLDELLHKGVHDDITQEDVDYGVIQTYLLAGQVIALHASHHS
jgi:hypothetical protein